MNLAGSGWTDWIQSIVVVGALLIAGYQTRLLVRDFRKRDHDLRVERALNMYRDLVIEGDASSAFHRLSVLLRNQGFRQFRTVAWKLPEDSDLNSGGLMDPTLEGSDTPFADLYRVMWYFERAHIAVEQNLIDKSVFFEAAGFHIWWWNQILRDLNAPKAMGSLRSSAADVTNWARNAGKLEEWRDRCNADFNGGPAT